MGKLFYVGFNGHQQCPDRGLELPKVISEWHGFEDEKLINVSCTHRVVAIENRDEFQLYGALGGNAAHKPQLVTKPEGVNQFAVCDEFLIASEKSNLWKFSFKNLEWEKLNVILSENSKRFWGEEVKKFSFLQNEVIILMSNGSVWKLVGNKLELVYQQYEKAVDVSSGFEHCLILTESGCVLSFGGGSRGQLGHDDLNSSPDPVQIAALEGLNIQKISSGGWHSCAVTDSGDLCTWGWNNFGQLSSQDNQGELVSSALPTFVDVGLDEDAKVVDVSCGSRHTIAKLETGELFASGWNLYSQLGVGSSEEKITKFTKCNVPNSPNGKLLAGSWYTILMDEFGKS